MKLFNVQIVKNMVIQKDIVLILLDVFVAQTSTPLHSVLNQKIPLQLVLFAKETTQHTTTAIHFTKTYNGQISNLTNLLKIITLL